MNYLLTILVLNTLSSCSCDNYAPGGPLNQKPDYTRMYNQYSKKILNPILEKYQLSIGAYGGSFMDEIHSFSYGFSSNKQTTRDQARALIIQITEDLKESINAYRELRPHLANYPLDEKNFTLTISFYDPATQEQYALPYIARVGIGGGGVYFRDNGLLNLQELPKIDETYEEAKSKVDAYLAQPGR